MRLSERVAKSVIEAVCRGARMRFHEVQSDRECDFDLVFPDGEIAALEVTASVDRRHLETLAVLTDERKGGQFVKAKLCKDGWYVHPEEGARIQPIRARIDEFLYPIEEAGITEFFAPMHSYENEAVRRIWTELRIEGGRRMKWRSSQLIGIAMPGRASWVDASQIVRALEAEAHKEDNVRKLEASGRPQRHLLVFVDSSNHDAWAPMIDGMMPSRDPRLPSAVTHAWVVSSAGELHRFRTLGFSECQGWRDYGVLVEPGP